MYSFRGLFAHQDRHAAAVLAQAGIWRPQDMSSRRLRMSAQRDRSGGEEPPDMGNNEREIQAKLFYFFLSYVIMNIHGSRSCICVYCLLRS